MLASQARLSVYSSSVSLTDRHSQAELGNEGTKAKQIAAFALVDESKNLVGEGKLEEAVETLRRAKDLNVDIWEVKQLTVLLPFFSWLADPKKDWKEVLTAIEQHPNFPVFFDSSSDLEPVIQRQEPSRRQVSQHFIDFWTNKIDLETLKRKLSRK